MDAFSKEKRERINQELLQRVTRTRAAYEQAKSEAIQLKTIREQLGSLNPDGTHASRNALRLEQAATKAYTDAIKALTEFTLAQRLPESTVQHSSQTGHFTCDCGEPLTFGSEPSTRAVLINQAREADRKVGECPACGRIYEVST
jgi:uncharacterized protein with PIN domain